MRRLALLALVLLALPASGAARPAGGTAVAVVVTGADRLVVLDVWETRPLRAPVRVPRGAQDVATTIDAKRVLVASPAAGAVTLLDATESRVLKVFRGLVRPVDVQVTPNGRRGYVLEHGRGRLLVLDLVRRRVVGAVAVGARPHRLAIADDLVWIAHDAPGVPLTVVDARTPSRPQVAGFLHAGGGTVTSLLHVPDSAWLLVTYRRSGVVAKLDAGVKRVVFRRRLGTRVGPIWMDWSTTNVWAGDVGGRVVVASSRTGRPVRTVEIGAAVRGIGGFGSYCVVRTPRDLRILTANGRRHRVVRVAAGIRAVDFAVLP